MENHPQHREEIIRRRCLFFTYNAALIVLGTVPLGELMTFQGWTLARGVSFGLYFLLLIPVVYGFTTATVGFWLTLRPGWDPLRISHPPTTAEVPENPSPTAVVMPIFNEDVPQVFRRLRAMYQSLQSTGQGDAFHFFVLSDSNDPSAWIAEEKAWFDLCSETGGFGRIFYRKRRVPLHNKSGNVADFCRRWGAEYKYMIVLDADSLMAGATMVELARIMDRNPRAGIVQTLPQMAFGRTLFQRVYQFGAHVAAGMFSAGMNYWQLGTASYWGHNAIIRIRPFMQHCAMPELPENCPLGRRILSHDTVEAALMRRAGYEVWLAYDLPGSYEEYPPHLMAAVQRDRRWCFGNLQHAWVVSTPGLRNPSRIHLLNGIMAYLSSPLWMLFLVWSVFLPVVENQTELAQVVGTPLVIRLTRFLALYVLAMLFIPKILAALQAGWSGRAKAFGGRAALALSALAETLVSMVVAPVLMVFHTRFVVGALTGATVRWGAQTRSIGEHPSLKDFVRPNLIPTLGGVVFAVLMVWRSPGLILWMTPILLGLILSIPLSYWLASDRLGTKSQRLRLFLNPPETEPASILIAYENSQLSQTPKARANGVLPAANGVFAVVIDPLINRLHASVLPGRVNQNPQTQEFRLGAAERLLAHGLEAVTPYELRTILWDAELIQKLHLRVWTDTSELLHHSWIEALAGYRASHIPSANGTSTVPPELATVPK